MLINASAIPVQAFALLRSAYLEQSNLNRGCLLDVNSSCISFITALQVAAVISHQFAYRITIVSADIASRGIDWQDKESSLILVMVQLVLCCGKKGMGASGIISYTHHRRH